MFKKKNPVIDPNSTDTVIGSGTVFEGKIKSQASLRIEGQIIGDIECLGDVIIGENGVARSNIQARSVTIAGSVNGNVTTKEALHITASGSLIGNASAHSLIIEEGGVFQGASKMEAKASSSVEHLDKEKHVQNNLSGSYNNTAAMM
ncbi:MAG TPA: polymer-forming cytoskeletal protein [Bacilli bacterium]